MSGFGYRSAISKTCLMSAVSISATKRSTQSRTVSACIWPTKIRKRRSERVRQSPQWQWHLDEVFVKIRGKTHYLWCAVDHEGEVLESFVTKTGDKTSELKFMRKAMRQPACRCDQKVPLPWREDERDRKCRAPGMRPAYEQWF